MRLTGVKNVDTEILNRLDDRELLNFCLTDKSAREICRYEPFWMNRLRDKYPHLMEYKKKSEKWKSLYLRMIYAISKLEEDYGIPYIPVEGYNPVDFYKESKTINIVKSGGETYQFPNRIYNYAMSIAARGGSLEIVKQMIRKGATELGESMRNAAENGHLNIVEYLTSKGPRDKDLEDGMAGAGRGGHLDIVKYLVSEGASDFGFLFFSAVEGKHKEVMKYAAEKGISNSVYDIATEDVKDPIIVDYIKN
jgi:hypothetical protein